MNLALFTKARTRFVALLVKFGLVVLEKRSKRMTLDKVSALAE
jgi:hypothetical protein